MSKRREKDKRDTRPHIMVTVFCGQERTGWIQPHLSTALATAFLSYSDRYLWSYAPMFAIHPVTAARNRAVVAMEELELRTGRPVAWLSMWDNDIAPQPYVWDVLATAPDEADIIILPYWVWSDLDVPMVCLGQWKDGMMVTPAPGEIPSEGWSETGVGGTGAMFIRGRVFKDGRLTKPFFKIKYDDLKAQKVSEDIYFTGMCKDAGLRIFTNTSFVCGHYRSLDIAQINAGMARLFAKYQKLQEGKDEGTAKS